MSRFGNVLWLALALACGTALATDEVRWAPDIPTARKAATQFKVPLLIHFYGDNCLPCKTLEERVYSKRELIDTLNKYFICVKVNASRDRQTAAEYQVHSWPTDVFVSADGKTLYQGVCQQDLSGYLSTLQNVAVMNHDRNVLLAAQQAAPNSAQPAYSGQAPNASSAAPTQGVVPPYSSAGTSVASHVPFPSGSRPAAPQIQSGPMGANQQPQALVGAVQGAQQQLAQPAGPTLGAYPGLPPQNLVAQTTAVSPQAGRQQNLAGYPGMPTMTTSNAAPAVPAPGFGSAASPAKRQEAQLVSNPYYPPSSSNATTTNTSLTSAALPNATAASEPENGSLDEGTLTPNAFPLGEATPGIDMVLEKPSQEFQASSSAATPSSEADAMLAIEGYCPVQLKTAGKWVQGDPKFSVKHRGRLYRMSSQEALDQFLQAPDASSPVLSGYDPLVFLEEGKLVEGSIQYGLHEQVSGTYILFSSAEAKQKYWKDFDRYTTALNAVLAKVQGR